MTSTVDIKYVQDGEGGDKTIVFLHGWPDNYHVWDKQVGPVAGRSSP